MTEQPDEGAEDEIPETSEFVDEEKGNVEFASETKEINRQEFSNRTSGDSTAVYSILLLLLSLLLLLLLFLL